MITVMTGSRLHFGLISLAEFGACRLDRSGTFAVPARRFGGVGLMIDRPGVCLRVEPAAAWSASGPLAARVLHFAERYRQAGDGSVEPMRIVVEKCPPEHSGLGVGTQLGLAVARALAAAQGKQLSLQELAARAGRGLRSAIGAHGFVHGGFLVDAGPPAADVLAPLVAHADFPQEWRIVVVLPPAEAGVHGECERIAFSRLVDDPERTNVLCRLVLLGLLPAIAERNLETFGAVLGEFNARAGEAFASEQGGVYASAASAELVDFISGIGFRGVGQSSWGPAVFAVVGDVESADRLALRLRDRFGLAGDAVFITCACNHGATVTT